MGQYYYPCSIEKKQHVYGHDYGNGLKLMEHSWIGNGFVEIVENLIKKGGAWFKDRIVWAGDYADNEKGRKKNLHTICENNKTTPSPYVRKKGEQKLRFLVNLDTNEYVDLNKVPVTEVYVWKDEKTGKKSKTVYRIHPLPILTCEGNGRGGGDYHGNSNLVGRWARNRVIMQKNKPNNKTELIFDLVE